MFPLMRLPKELIFRVVNLVHPGDVESLVLCNKTINLFARETLSRHLELKRKYSVITLKDYDELADSDLEVRNDELSLVHVRWFDPSIFALMAEIIRNGDIVYYPVSLHLSSDAFEHAKDKQLLVPDGVESEEYYSQDQIANRKSFLTVRDYTRNMPLLSKEAKAEWSFLLHTTTNKDIRAALLFILLPNIQSVTFGIGGYSPEVDLIKMIVENIADTNRSGNIGSDRSRKYLSKLQTVTLNFDDPVINTLEAILPFAMLPSVRLLKGEKIQQTPYQQDQFLPLQWPSTFPTRHSTVTEISFKRSAIGAQHFRSFLAGIAALQRFTYHHWRDEPECANFQPLGIVEALGEFAAKSLVRLELTASWDELELEDDQYVKTLQMFVALKYLRSDEQYLEGLGELACTGDYKEGEEEPKMDVKTLRDWAVAMLPRTLEHHAMNRCSEAEWPHMEAWLLFREHAKLKDEQLPDMEHLKIDEDHDLPISSDEPS